MKHVIRAARYAGVDLTAGQIDRFREFEEWLQGEGLRGGGIGPNETERLQQRHIADSILFAAGFPDDLPEVWDLGAGVGLPGIPLAILRPETGVVLIDRGERRVGLARRAVRVLGLENCQVLQADIATLTGQVGGVVSRASLSPGQLSPLLSRLLTPGGVAVVGGSWSKRPSHPGWETVEIPADVLDQPVWLLMMRRP